MIYHGHGFESLETLLAFFAPEFFGNYVRNFIRNQLFVKEKHREKKTPTHISEVIQSHWACVGITAQVLLFREEACAQQWDVYR